MALEFHPPRPHTKESFLQTLVANVLNVTHWTRVAQGQDNDAVRSMRSSLHTAGLGGVGGTTELASHYIFRCPCTGQRVSEQKSTPKTECQQGFWYVRCSHAACKKSGAAITRSLGRPQAGTKGRLWMPSNWRPLNMVIAQSVASDDTQTQTLLEMGLVTSAQMQHLCIAVEKLGWDYNLTQHVNISRTGQTTYLILPDVALDFLRDLQCGHQDQWLHAT